MLPTRTIHERSTCSANLWESANVKFATTNSHQKNIWAGTWEQSSYLSNHFELNKINRHTTAKAGLASTDRFSVCLRTVAVRSSVHYQGITLKVPDRLCAASSRACRGSVAFWTLMFCRLWLVLWNLTRQFFHIGKSQINHRLTFLMLLMSVSFATNLASKAGLRSYASCYSNRNRSLFCTCVFSVIMQLSWFLSTF